jgi:ribosomal-protein-serine acetyltransferase
MSQQFTDGVVTLTPPREEDAEAVAAAVQASLDTLMPWLPWASADYDPASAREWIRHAADPGVHGFAIRVADGTLIGSCGLQHHDAPNHCIELGYWIGSAYTGNGYATRASRLLIAHAFEALDVHRVTILVSVHNERSQRVAERLTGPPEATLRERLHVRDEWHDAFVYRVIAPGS